MIINTLRLVNYGLFKGEHIIDLTPSQDNRKNITLISGQNGVGKSTILEAISIGLLGSLAIDTRLSETAYEAILLRRAHRGRLTTIAETQIDISFQFVKSGKTVLYRIQRKWVNDPACVKEEVLLWEDGKELSDLSRKEKNLFLRELIQPGFAKVLFFDGERLASLFEGNNLNSFLQETCIQLFGLNFVDQLRTDLTFFVNKIHQQNDNSEKLNELGKVEKVLQEIELTRKNLNDELQDQNALLEEIHKKIDETEAEISKQGRWVTKELEKLRNQRQALELAAQSLKKDLVESFNYIGPILFCKQLAISLKSRLQAEREIEKWQHTKEILKVKLNDLKQFLSKTEYLKGGKYERENKNILFAELKKILLNKPDTFSGDEVIYHDIADNERTKLVGWIEHAQLNLSKQLAEKSKELQSIEEKQKLLNRQQQSFSREELIQPLLKILQEHNKQGGSTEQRCQSLQRQLEETARRAQFYQQQAEQIRTTLSNDNSNEAKLNLAEKTKKALEKYSRELQLLKVSQLEIKTLSFFNKMCRKQDYFDKIQIDSHTWSINLERRGNHFDSSQLSAGEKQLLILSIIWSLRELTNISLPLIIDTPLARLDAQHRQSFLNIFLPSMQPQVIMIGTDMEVANDVIQSLELHVNKHYRLSYSGVTEANVVSRTDPNQIAI